jgi:serine/threonine protein kinase
MTPERWQEVEALFHEALDRPPLERASFLDHACAGDEELREEATTLIAAHDEAGAFIEQPAMAQDAYVLLGDHADENLGREIGPYRIVERIGAGGMAEVYLAEDTRLNRLVALKLLPPYFASDDFRLRRFQSEARAASALNHPNILTIHEVGENAGVYFIATEFIDGQTIRGLIRNDQLPLEDIFDIVEQVASALSVAHAAGIVHRDIKPENIMRRRDGLVKVLDFGIAKLLEPETPDRSNATGAFRTLTEAGLVMGTANYMSPEQARGLQVDERADIWSLGVVLYEMLTGHLPFSGATRMDTLVAVLDREPTPLSQVANEFYLLAPLLQSVIDKCLSKDIEKRYRTAAELLAELNNAREQLSNPEFTIEVREQESRAASKFPSRVVVALVALLIVITAGTIAYRKSRPHVVAPVGTPAAPAKLYSQMSEREQLEFVATQGQRISGMMSHNPEKLNDDAVRIIKTYVDWYRKRPSRPGAEPLGAVYERGQPYVPVIARAFATRKVPVVIGIYLPVIESAYRECPTSELGGKGLFQFLPGTAKHYGVGPDEMCNVEKMSDAAAHYIADRMAELGEDSGSVTLVLLSFNRGEEWVRNTLRRLRGTQNYERNFWTLLANNQTLDESFNKETAGYVPNFFAAAIIGENPAAFGLQTPPLTSLSSTTDERR